MKIKEFINEKMEKFLSSPVNKNYLAAGIVILIIMFLFYFLPWSFINNTKVGIEVSVNGWNYILATLSNKFKSTDSIYGDIAVPFYYYAKGNTVGLGVVTVINAALVLVTIGLSFLAHYKYNNITIISIATSAVLLFISYLVCFIMGLAMNGSKILSAYCGGNPDCSIGSLAFIPTLVVLFVVVEYVLQAYKIYKVGEDNVVFYEKKIENKKRIK